ncbi:hypothetical protein [Phocaeicola barnesiae]|uniref:hypothetical protein n=1 Tax=Phocaeicola barnesiae TaxID=376804 RepID=UPI0025A3C21B|nr:hypothetical protein [Phocaeicola barnesiae]
MKQIPFYFTMLTLLLIWSCDNKQQSVSIDNLIVGKWEMVEYGSGYVNALDTLGFYKNGKADCPPETGKFTYRLIKPDSLIIYNKGFGEQHYKILKLSNDSLIKQIRRQRIYTDSIDEPIIGEIEKYIKVTDK